MTESLGSKTPVLASSGGPAVGVWSTGADGVATVGFDESVDGVVVVVVLVVLEPSGGGIVGGVTPEPSAGPCGGARAPTGAAKTRAASTKIATQRGKCRSRTPERSS